MKRMTFGTDHDHAAKIIVDLWQMYSSALLRWVRRRSAGSTVRSEVEDVVQEVFVAFWRLLVTGRFHKLVPSHPQERDEWCRAMLYRIARFRLSRVRGRPRPMTNVECLDRDPGGHVDHLLNRVIIREAIGRCSRRQREVLLLLQQGFKYREIAVRLQVSEDTLRARCHRAKLNLLRQMTTRA